MVPDAHCHLDQVPEPDDAVEEAVAAGVRPILAVSMDAASAESILELRERHREHVLAGIGLHPSRVPETTATEQEAELRRLEAFLPHADFIGEVGLDYKDALSETDRRRQREALVRQLGWAEERGLPANLHSRRADRDVLDFAIDFHRRTGLGALMHWFTHSAKLARLCAENGIFISPGPSVLIDPAVEKVVRAIADRTLLIETDSPVVYGGEGAARPVWARRVLARLAALRDTEEAPLEAMMRDNLDRYLGGSHRLATRAPDESGL